MKATIVIPNLNGKGWLADSIDSVFAQTEQDFELIVVDNGSTDESLAIARGYATDPRFTLIENAENTGFSHAVNQGIALAQGEYVVLFNNDAFAEPAWLAELIKTAEKNGYSMAVLKAVEEVNDLQKSILFDKLMAHYDGDIKGKTIALWGLAFKPETDDMREAPALVLIEKILAAGGSVKVYDPIAIEECKRRIGDKVEYAADMYDAALDADALMLVTEWKEFRMPSWEVMHKTMAQPVILDGRNIYDHSEVAEQGFDYYSIGR